MYTLYIDTHFVSLVFGLFKDAKLIAKREIESDKHTVNAVNMLSDLLETNNIIVDDISNIIVINGPGSFTGVRIGVVIAKILGYTKNIKIKSLSYLEAMAISYNKDIVVGIKDRNGVFIGEFDKNHSLKQDYYYVSNEEFKANKENVVLDVKVDLEKVYEYMKNKTDINPHLIKPLYVKKIEVMS